MKKRYVALGVAALSSAALAGAAVLLHRHSLSRSLGSMLGTAPTSRVSVPMQVAQNVYDGKLGDGWTDWGWGPHEFTDGPVRVQTSGYGGIIFHHDPLNERFGGLLFRFLAPKAWGDFLHVSVDYGQKGSGELPDIVIEPGHVADVGGGWREAFVPWDELNPQNLPIDRVIIAARLAEASDWMSLDKVVLTKPAVATAPRATQREVTLEISCDEPSHPISPRIYGVSMASYATGASANRIGGNPISRLNWDLGGAWNTGSDWFFENVRGEGDVWSWIEDGVSHGVETALVVPMIGWVAKDTTSSGFPRSKFEKQRKFDQYRAEAGDGVDPDGKPIKPGPPTETSVEATPETIERWIGKMREADARRGKRGVGMYILDNEPALWNETHRDVHPEPVGYDELLDRTIRYGTAIRKADPDAVIAGPAEWGWTNYFTSAKDRGAHGLSGPDRQAHGDIALIPWYLGQLAEHERKTGVRVLDVVDVHFYPQGENLYGGNARVDPDGAALRIRSTRALWDPEYRDESWIAEPVRLIPRLKEWVVERYPGRKVSLGEWSFGADDHISGALATAEALGRFGQQGLDAAFFWAGPKQGSRAFWAFRAFRNFDGKGARFLDQSLKTTEAPGVSLFASRDANRSHIVAIVLNLDPDSRVRAQLNLESCGTVTSRTTFRYGGDSKELSEDRAETKPNETTLLPYSLAVLAFEFTPAD